MYVWGVRNLCLYFTQLQINSRTPGASFTSGTLNDNISDFKLKSYAVLNRILEILEDEGMYLA